MYMKRNDIFYKIVYNVYWLVLMFIEYLIKEVLFFFYMLILYVIFVSILLLIYL